MPLEESGVNLVVEGLASFLGGLNESNDAIGDLANTAAGVGAAGFSALGDAASAVGDVVAGAFTAALAVGVAGIAALAGGIAYGIGQAIEAEAAVANLNRMIVNLGEDAPITTQGALDLAAQFQGLALGSDDAVLAIIDLGVKSRNISEEEFPAFIQASLDLGAVMGDNATAARLLARAQEDPLGVLGPLRRQGILFTEEQEAQIKTLQASGDVAGAYAIVMEQVGAVTGGAALTNTQTLSGMIETFKNTIGEAWETIGTAFLPALHAIGDVVTTSVLPAVTILAQLMANFFSELMTGNDVGLAIEELGGQFDRIFPGMGVHFETLSLAFRSFYDFVTTNLPFVQAAFEETLTPLIQIGTDIATVITGTLIPALSSAFTTIFGEAPPAEAVLDALLAAIISGAESAALWVTTVLVPAVQSFSAWIVNDFAPAAASVVDWLQVNLPIAIQMASDFWTNTLQPALAAVWTFITTSVIPAIESIVNWLQINIPIAIQKASDFWNTVLKPALDAVWAFITTSVIPIFTALVEWLQVTIPAAVQTMSDYWNNTLKPALDAVWSFITISVIPIFTSLQTVFSELTRIIGEVFIAMWNNTLKPALEDVHEFLRDTLNPILTGLGNLFSITLTPIFNDFKADVIDAMVGAFIALSDALHAVKDWLDDVAAALASIHIPGDLTPGSPTPFEIGLRGAADAMAELAKQVNPLDTALAELNRNALSGASAALEQIINPVMVADRAAATPTTINNYNTADIDIHGANVGRNRQTVTDDVLLGLQLGFGLST